MPSLCRNNHTCCLIAKLSSRQFNSSSLPIVRSCQRLIDLPATNTLMNSFLHHTSCRRYWLEFILIKEFFGGAGGNLLFGNNFFTCVKQRTPIKVMCSSHLSPSLSTRTHSKKYLVANASKSTKHRTSWIVWLTLQNLPLQKASGNHWTSEGLSAMYWLHLGIEHPLALWKTTLANNTRVQRNSHNVI